MASPASPRRRGLTALAALLVFTAAAPPQTSSDPQDDLTETQRILHVLNRLGYGPRPGDIERVRALGIDAYIELQLHPENIESPVLAEMLWGYPVAGLPREELIEADRPAVARAERYRDRVVARAERRGAPPEGSDATMRERLRDHLANGALPPEVTRRERRWEDFEYFATLVWQAAFSEAQLEQVMVDFWFNHFNVTSGDPYMHLDYGENVIRRHALGRFQDLLVATAMHPAMLLYLDNWLSTAPEDVVRQRIEAWEPSGDENKALWQRRMAEFLEQANGLNENYGRELMELHTLGVDGGYTQEDVEEVARAFTGWTLAGGLEHGDFEFNPLLHEEGDKTVLGEVIPSGGVDEGMQILEILAHHPSTAHYVSTKLVRRFVADDPPEAIVEAAAERFLETDGDIREVLRAIFYHPDFFAPEHYQAKLKKPLEAVASALRAVDAEVQTQFMGPNFGDVLERMGEELRQHETPDGYPDVASAWMSTNALIQRLSFAMDLASESLRQVEVDLDAARELFEILDYPEPTPEQIADARALFETMQSEAGGAEGMMADDMTAEETDPSPANMGGGERPDDRPPVDYESLEARVVSVALVLGSPDFQKR